MSKLHLGLLQGLIQSKTEKESNHCLENSAGNGYALGKLSALAVVRKSSVSITTSHLSIVALSITEKLFV